MTRQQAKSAIRSRVTVHKDHIKSLSESDKVIDNIYDIFEEIVSSLQEENERLKNMLKAHTKDNK